MQVLYVVAFILAAIVQFQSKGANLLAWAVLAIAFVPALAFFRGL